MTTAVITRDLIVAQTRALKLPGVARVFDTRSTTSVPICRR